MKAMRTDQVAREALERLRRLCTEATPGMYELVRHASVQAPSAASDPGARPVEPGACLHGHWRDR